MARNKGLGRGLEAIFDDNSVDSSEKGAPTKIRISMIEPKKDQPRRLFDREALASLADSIAANGVLQPIIVRETSGGMYGIIAGERRWRASKLAGLTEIPAVIIDADEFSAAKIAMIENLQREDLNPCEEALGYRDLMANYGLTQEQLSTHIGKSRSAIANSLRLLDLPEEVLTFIVDGELSAGHGRTLLGLKNKDYSSPSRFTRAALLRKWVVDGSLSPQAAGDDTQNAGAASPHTQFFRILAAVSPMAGAVMTPEGKCHRTLYTCCMDTAAGVYRYHTEVDPTIRRISFSAQNLNGEAPFIPNPDRISHPY